MTAYTVREAQTHLFSILRGVEAGQEVVITRAQKPVARLVPMTAPLARRFGPLRFDVPDDFDAPLPDDDLASWDGRG